MPILGALLTTEYNGVLITGVNIKSSHTDPYLHLNNYYLIGAKYSVINILGHMTKMVSSTPKLLRTKK